MEPNPDVGTSDLAAHRSPAIHDLPSELLQVIFTLTAADSNFTTHYKTVASLCLVCRFWNGLAQDTPVLWADINTVLGPVFVKRLLELSRVHPIRVSCFLPDAVGSPLYDAHVLSFQLVFEHVTRWVQAYIHGPIFEGFHRLLSMDAPILESLSINCARYVQNETLPAVFRGTCDRLHSLKLCGVSFDWSDPITLQANSLTHHFVHRSTYPTPAQLLFILDNNSNLERLSLDDYRPNVGIFDGVISFEISITTPRNLSLGFSIFPLPTICAILDRFRTATKDSLHLTANVSHLEADDHLKLSNSLLASFPYCDYFLLVLSSLMVSISGGLGLPKRHPLPRTVRLSLRMLGVSGRTFLHALQEAIERRLVQRPSHTILRISDNLLDDTTITTLDSMPSITHLETRSAEAANRLCELLTTDAHCDSLKELEELWLLDPSMDINLVLEMVKKRYGQPRYGISPLKRLALEVYWANAKHDSIESLRRILGASILRVDIVDRSDNGSSEDVDSE